MVKKSMINFNSDKHKVLNRMKMETEHRPKYSNIDEYWRDHRCLKYQICLSSNIHWVGFQVNQIRERETFECHFMGPGKSTWPFSAERRGFPLPARLQWVEPTSGGVESGNLQMFGGKWSRWFTLTSRILCKKINNYLRESNRSHERVNLKNLLSPQLWYFKGFFFFRKSDFCQKI